MLIEELNLPEKKEKQLKNKGLKTTDDIKYMLPRRYYDFRRSFNPQMVLSGEKCIMVCTVTEIRNKPMYVEVVAREKTTMERVSIKWFRQPYKYDEVRNLYDMDIAVGGTFKKDEWGNQYVNPEIFTTDVENAMRIYPIYPKIVGMSAAYYQEILDRVMNETYTEDILSEDFRTHFDLISEDEMLNRYHYPTGVADIKAANKKVAYTRLYQIAKKMVTDAESVEKNSSFIPKILKTTNELITALPYSLTEDQRKIILEIVKKAQGGHRVNALIQGDVGSGKTVCAFLLMFSMADNGYQSALMAPTGVLAKQHYAELSSYAEKFGYKTAYLGGDLKAKEKREVLKGIKNGEYIFVVGTHAVISDDVEFNNLGLTIVDEEHKFGVIQRDNLRAKAKEGVHSISMSATPIPRSLALTLYGDAMDIYTISTMPAGRLPVKTGVVNSDDAIFRLIQAEAENGHQAYIVCPMIDSNDDSEEDAPVSVEDVYKSTEAYFSTHNPNIKAAVITGKMKDAEKSEIINAFSKNEVQILIATTIIEVGVNVPNATVIAIMNAERFGLAGLHQLRGRVGRGNLQSYCVLKSLEKENERLAVMCKTTNGFEIAEEDLKIRGTGDFLGTRQSGDNENVRLMLKYPQIYQEIKEYIKEKELNGCEKLKL